jgi:hypothetical protein
MRTSPKFSLDFVHKSEFSWAQLYARISSNNTGVKRLGLNKRKGFEFEIQASQHL